MLEKVRRSMQSGFTYVLVAGLTVIFMFFFGMPSQTCSGAAGRRRALLAQVGGESIHTEDVNVIYNRIWGTDRTDDKDKYRKQRARALRNLILIELFADRARTEGLRVSSSEFKKYIKDPARNAEYRYRYGSKGSFNGQYYKAYVQNRLRTRLEKYERFKREELLARKYVATLASQAAIPRVELDRARTIKETKLDLAFVGLDAETLRDSVEVAAADVRSFLQNNRKEVEKYYENHKSEKYSTPERVRIRRVYIERPDDSAGEQQKVRAKQKWKEAKKRVFDDGESVASVASELGGETGEKTKGMMGWSKLENIDKDIKKAIEGAEVGDIEKVIADHGYMIVKLEGRKEAETTPLSEVENAIAETLLQKERADALVGEVRKKLLEQTKESGSLKEALKVLQSKSDEKVWTDLSIETTGEFTLEAKGPPPQLAARMGGKLPPGLGGSWFKIPKIGESKKLAIDAFKKLSEKNPVSDEVYEVGGTKYIVELASRKEPKSGDESGAAVAGPPVSFNLETQKVSELVGRWPLVFSSWGRWASVMERLARRTPAPPMKEYGPWIDRQLGKALEDGTVKLYPKQSKVANILDQSLKPGGDVKTPDLKKKKKGAPAAGKKKKGSPIRLKMGGDSKKAQQIKLKKALQKAKKRAGQGTGSKEKGSGAGKKGSKAPANKGGSKGPANKSSKGSESGE